MSRMPAGLCIDSSSRASEPHIASKLIVSQDDVNVHVHETHSTLNSSAMGMVDCQSQLSYDTMTHTASGLFFATHGSSNSSVSSHSSMFNVPPALYTMALAPNNEQDLCGICHWAGQLPQCHTDFYDPISGADALNSFDAQFLDSYEATSGLCFSG
jgi:hypothetical protein